MKTSLVVDMIVGCTQLNTGGHIRNYR